MTILKNISAGASESGEYREPRGVIHAVHEEPSPGFHRKIQLGAGGIIARRGDDAVAIPLDEIWRLAENHCPALKAPAQVAAQPTESE